MICEKCNNEHDGTYGSGRFCSEQCARSFSRRSDDREELKEATCIDCGVSTLINKRTSIMSALCSDCTRKRRLERWQRSNSKRKGKAYKPKEQLKSILEVSKRTITKIVGRMGLECTICKWCVDGVNGDIHHIIPKSEGGSDDMSNLTYVCPNCHRMLHAGVIEESKIIPLSDYIGDSWKEFYNIKDTGGIPAGGL